MSSPSIELILRTVQKDNENTDEINHKFLRLIDALSHFLSFNFPTQNIENLSKFIFNFSNYILNKNKLTPGEEYTKSYKKFNKNNKISIMFYIITISFKNLVIKFIHSKFSKFIENKIIKENESKNNFSFVSHFSKKIYQNFPNFEAIIEKLEEMQFCLFFIKGTYFDIFQRIFNIPYESSSNKEYENEIIKKDGFIFFGYLMATKLILESFLFIKNTILSYREETIKIKNENNIIEEVENNLGINFKLKNENLSNKLISQNSSDKSCLLCLEIRKETSSTPCGHLFCWSCIIKYLQSKNQCPYCRSECLPQNVIYLQNYK